MNQVWIVIVDTHLHTCMVTNVMGVFDSEEKANQAMEEAPAEESQRYWCVPLTMNHWQVHV